MFDSTSGLLTVPCSACIFDRQQHRPACMITSMTFHSYKPCRIQSLWQCWYQPTLSHISRYVMQCLRLNCARQTLAVAETCGTFPLSFNYLDASGQGYQGCADPCITGSHLCMLGKADWPCLQHIHSAATTGSMPGCQRL